MENPEPEKSSKYVHSMASASEALLKFLKNDQFIGWAISSLLSHLRSSHVSIALLDTNRKTFSIQHSVGSRKFPERLVALSKQSPLIEWFSNPGNEAPTPVSCGTSNTMPLSPELSEEMRRYSLGLCAKIGLDDCADGFLLAGKSETRSGYSPEDCVYFQALANDIAIGIKKQAYYRASHYDPLTNLLNRQSLVPELDALIKYCQTHGYHFALCMVDLDNFKQINDRYGHQAGDEVLKVVAQILQKSVRESDRVFRYGGEEFLIVLNNLSRTFLKTYSSEDFFRYSRTAIERVRRQIALRPIRLSEHSLHVTASIGMTLFDKTIPKTREQIIGEADRAVYISKQSGKNRVTVYEAES